MDHHHHRRGHWHLQRLKRDDNRPITKVHFVTLEPTFNTPVAEFPTVVEVKTKKTIQSKKPVVTTKAPPSDKPKQTQKSTPITTSTTSTTTSTTISTTSTKVIQPPSRPTTTSTSRAPDTTKPQTQAPPLTGKVSSSSVSYTMDSALRTSDMMQTPTSISSSNGHGSGGASVGGIVAGCLLALFFLVFIAVFFYYKHKQRVKGREYRETEDEKSAGLVSGAAATAGFSGGASINEKTDNVSLRTITQFSPNLDPPAASPVVKTGPSGGTGRHAIPRKPIPLLALSNPLQLDLQSTTTSAVPDPSVIPTAQSSPTLSAFSGSFAPGTPVQGPVNAAAAIATGKLTPVHRVQMDYFPSQADELDIRIGQLVRMLHEYDDGWALCVRMDRSQQGVCPRTCLSDRPVKPRPNPSPGSPANQQRRVQVQTNFQQSPPNSQKYIPYSGSRPSTPSQQPPSQRLEASQVQPIPQITVSRVESDFPKTKDRQEPRATSSSDAPTFHAM